MAVKNGSVQDVSVRTDNLGNVVASLAIDFAGDYLGDQVSGLFGLNNESEIGRVLGTSFSSGVTAATNTLANNVLKGQALTSGLGQNVGSSLAGAGVGLASNYLGKGISSLGGNSKLSKALGAGVSTFLGTKGGNLVSKLFGKGSSINPYGLAALVAGSMLGAATGPSKEYEGKYGTVTLVGDVAYDAATMAVNAVPVWGLLASGLMALNKGLTNIFGSTSGMTTLDAILGSAFTGLLTGVGAPLKWVNMWGAKTTDKFGKQSWLNSEKTNSFMGNAFGDLNDKFDKAREESGKTYGTFSRGAYNDALKNILFANDAWDKILSMADLNEILKIRSQYMSSINNQRYAQQIQGGFTPIARGKQGMKIFNNATNHNIGMRLLSAAALIDNKAMILSAQGGTKILSQKSLEELVIDKQKAFEEKIVKPIMIGYDKNRAFTLTNAGSLTGAHLSEEMIEYIMSEAEKAGVDLQTALGIVGAESTFGNPTDDKSSWKISSGIRREFDNVYPGTSLHINTGGDAIDELKLVNFYDPLEDQNPYTLLLNEAKRRAKKGEDYNKVLSEGMNYADKLALQSIPTGSLMLLAFEYFKKYGEKYNPDYLKKTGQSYVKHVLKKGKEALQSPEIQQAINNIILRRMLPLDNKQVIPFAQSGTKIPKLLYAGQIVKSDNTRVLKPIVIEPIERKLLPGLQFFNNHGLIIVVEPKQEVVLLDNRDSKVREESHKKSVQVRKQELMKKAEEQTALVAEAVLDRTMPSYWVEKATGEDLGTAGSLAVDLVSPFVLGKGLQLTGKGLLRGFRWIFNKSGLLVKVPINKFTTAKSVYNEGNMSDLEIFKASGDGFKEAIVAYKPGGVWYERQIANGVPKEEVDRLASEYLNSLYNTTISIDRSTLSDAVAVALPRIEGGNIKSTLIMDPRYTKNYTLTKDAAIHETGHASTKNIEPINSLYRTPETERYYQLAEESSPETKKAMEYNESIRPEVKESALDEILSDETAMKHFKNVDPLLEIRQRAFAAELDAANKNVTMDEYINNPRLWNLNFKLLAEIYDMETLKYYMKHYKTIVFPLVGGSTVATLYNTNK